MSPTVSVKSKFHELCDAITSSTKTLSPTKKARNLDKLLHLYFNDNSFREEIFKAMKNPNFCFLHEIILTNSDTIISQHLGKKSFAKTQFDPVKYRKEQIDPCKSNIMAIIISMRTPTNTITPVRGHSNVLIIQKNDSNKTLEAELFEPHGKKRPTDFEIEDIQFINLLKDLFPEYTIKFIPPIDLCPKKKGLQGRVKSGNWDGTCTVFTMWYAFLRLLSPSTSRKDIYEYMFKVFESESPEDVIEYITTAFTDLVKININEGTVNGRVIPKSQTQEFKIQLEINNLKKKQQLLLTNYYKSLIVDDNKLSFPKDSDQFTIKQFFETLPSAYEYNKLGLVIDLSDMTNADIFSKDLVDTINLQLNEVNKENELNGWSFNISGNTMSSSIVLAFLEILKINCVDELNMSKITLTNGIKSESGVFFDDAIADEISTIIEEYEHKTINISHNEFTEYGTTRIMDAVNYVDDDKADFKRENDIDEDDELDTDVDDEFNKLIWEM